MEQNKILEGNLSKNIMLFFLPIWLGTFCQMLYNTADAVIVGNFVGKQALAAVGGPTGTIINLLVGFFVGLSSGAGVVIAQYYGAQNIEKASLSMHSSIAIAIGGGVLLMCVGIPLSPLMLKAMGTPADILEYAVIYIRIYFAGSVFNLVYNIGSGVLRAMGNSKKPLQFLIVSSIVNIVLDIVFVVYMNMGVMGAAVATVISQAVSAVFVIITLMGGTDERKLHLNKIAFDRQTCGEIFKIGIPTGLQSVLFSVSNITIQSCINSFGTDAVAAWTSYGKLDAMFWMTLNSFGITVTTFVSQNFGAKNYARVRQCVKVGVILSSIATLSLAGMLYFGSVFF
ncbi:MAG: MATE family efflux transporter, partial [Oscillospiraceae bacterium]